MSSYLWPLSNALSRDILSIWGSLPYAFLSMVYTIKQPNIREKQNAWTSKQRISTVPDHFQTPLRVAPGAEQPAQQQREIPLQSQG